MLPFEDKLPFENLPFETEEDNSPYGQYVAELQKRKGTQKIPTSPGDVSYYDEEPLSQEDWQKEQDKKLLKRMGESAIGVPDAALSFALKLPAQAAAALTPLYGAIRGLPKGETTESMMARVMQGPAWTDPKTEQGEKYLGKVGEALQPFGLSPYANMGQLAARSGARGAIKKTPVAPEVKTIPKKIEEIPAKIDEPLLPFENPIQQELPFSSSVEEIRAHQLVNEPTGDMFNDLYQQQKSFDPYQEQLQKQADAERMSLERVAEEGRKQQEIDNAFIERQRQLFDEEQTAKQEAILDRLETKIEEPLRQERNVPRSELGAIDIQTVQEAITKFKNNLNNAGDVLHSFKGAFNEEEMTYIKDQLTDPKSRTTVVLISPNDYHKLAAQRYPHDSKTIQTLDRQQSIREGLNSEQGLTQIPQLFIDTDAETGVASVVGHEGRHRMDVFKEKGIDLVPVAIRDFAIRWGENPYRPKWIRPENIKNSNLLDQPFPEILTQQENKPSYLSSQRGGIDIKSIGEAFQKVAKLNKDSPELEPAKAERAKDVKREAVYNSIPGLDAFRPIWDNPEKVVAAATEPNAAKLDLSPIQLKTAKTVKPGMRTVRVSSNNPAVGFVQQATSHVRTWADAQTRKFLTNPEGAAHRWENLSKDEQVQVAALLKQGSDEIRDFTVAELTEAGYNQKQIDAVQAWYKAKDYLYDFANEQLTSVEKEGFPKRPGWMPGVFEGDFWSLVLEDDKVVGYVGTNTKAGYNSIVKDLQKENPNLVITPMKKKGLEGNFRRSDLAAGMADIMSMLAKNDPRFADVQARIQEITKDRAHAWLGAELHTRNKKGIFGTQGNKPWEKDAHKSAQELMRAAFKVWEEETLSYAMLPKTTEITALVNNPEVMAAWPRAIDYINDYMYTAVGSHVGRTGQILNNTVDLVTEAVSFNQLGPTAIRGTVNQYTKRMGQLTQGFGNIVYTGMQWLQPFQTALPEFYRAGKTADILAAEFKGIQMSAKLIEYKMAESQGKLAKWLRSKMGDKVKFTPDEVEIYKFMEDKGLFTFSEYDDVSKTTQSKAGRYVDTAIDFNRNQLGERPTRPLVFLVITDLLRRHETIPEAEILPTAYELTMFAMDDYHPWERPLMYQKMGVLGQLAGNLKQYLHGRVNQTAQWVKESPKKPQMLLTGLVAMSVLQGYKGAPGYDEFDSLVKYLTGKFGNKQVSIADIVSKNAPEWLQQETPMSFDKERATWDDYLAYGALSGATGINFSSRLGAAQLLPNTAVGAISPYAEKAVRFGEQAMDLGRNPKAAQNMGMELVPSSMKGLLEDYLNKNEAGEFTDKQGRLDYQRTPFDRSVKRLGLTSLDESKYKEKVYQGNQAKFDNESRRARLTGEAIMKFNQLGEKYMQSEEFVKLRNEYIDRGGDPTQLINSIIHGKMESRKTPKQRAEGTPSDVGSIRRFQYYND